MSLTEKQHRRKIRYIRARLAEENEAHVALVQEAGCWHPALYVIDADATTTKGWCALCRGLAFRT